MLCVEPPKHSQGQHKQIGRTLTLQMQDEPSSSQEHLSPSERSDAAQSRDSFYTAQVGSTRMLDMFLGCKLMLCYAFQSWVSLFCKKHLHLHHWGQDDLSAPLM